MSEYRKARFPGLLRVPTEHPELDGKPCIEDVNVLGFNGVEHALGFVFRNGENDLHRLVGEIQQMSPTMCASMPGTLGAVDDRDTMDSCSV